MVAADSGVVGGISLKYMEQLTDPNPAIRRGSALALGVLPYELLANSWRDVLLKLCSCCLIEVQQIFFSFSPSFLGDVDVSPLKSVKQKIDSNKWKIFGCRRTLKTETLKHV